MLIVKTSCSCAWWAVERRALCPVLGDRRQQLLRALPSRLLSARTHRASPRRCGLRDGLATPSPSPCVALGSRELLLWLSHGWFGDRVPYVCAFSLPRQGHGGWQAVPALETLAGSGSGSGSFPPGTTERPVTGSLSAAPVGSTCAPGGPDDRSYIMKFRRGRPSEPVI